MRFMLNPPPEALSRTEGLVGRTGLLPGSHDLGSGDGDRVVRVVGSQQPLPVGRHPLQQVDGLTRAARRRYVITCRATCGVTANGTSETTPECETS